MTAGGVPRHVLFLLHHLRDGAGHFHLDLARALIRGGVRVTVASSGGPLEKRFAAAGARVDYVPVEELVEAHVDRVSLRLRLRRLLLDGYALRRLRRICRGESVDVVQSQSVAAHFLAARLHAESGIPFVMKLGTAAENDRPAADAAARAARLVAISDEVRDYLVATGVKPERIEVIPNMVDVARSAAALRPADAVQLRARFGIPPAAPLVAAVIRADEVKEPALLALLDAWARGREALGEAVLVLVGGGDGAVGRRMREHAHHENWLAGRVRVAVTPYQEDPTRFMAAAEIVIAAGATAVQAMAAGKPVFTLASLPVRGVSSDGPIGPGNAAAIAASNFTGRNRKDKVSAPALAESVRALLADPEARRRLGAFGRAFAASCATEAVAERYLALYRSAVS